MWCERLKTPGGNAIICRGGRRIRCACGQPATRLCDWIVSGRAKRQARCSAPMCERCTTRPSPDKDLCPMHAERWATHPRNPSRSPP